MPGGTINQPIASVSSTGTRKFLQYDRHGSVIAVANNGGTEIEGPYTYDTFGSGAPTTGVAYKYVGMRLDPETGLYFDRARYYSSILGRFFQPDPVGYTADLNLYPYVGNDPLDRIDPTGLWQTCPNDPNCIQATTNTSDNKVPPTTLNGAREDSIKAAIPNYKVTSGDDEKLGYNIQGPGGANSVRTDVSAAGGEEGRAPSLSNSQKPTSDKTGIPPAGATDVIHGHIMYGRSASDGLIDAAKGLGDAQPLERGMTNTTVHGERAGVRETPGGRLQFRMLKGRMTEHERQELGKRLDVQQRLIENYFMSLTR